LGFSTLRKEKVRKNKAYVFKGAKDDSPAAIVLSRLKKKKTPGKKRRDPDPEGGVGLPLVATTSCPKKTRKRKSESMMCQKGET